MLCRAFPGLVPDWLDPDVDEHLIATCVDILNHE